jgi:tRNA-specific 2-thiouridylase
MALDRPDTLNSLGFAKPPARRGSSSRCRAASTAPSWPRCWPRKGYDVVGVTLQLYDHGAALAKKGACCAGRDIHDARRVAEEMGFPHYVLDYENTFREAVIDEFADSYLAGATPVPCIRCNERVKFKDLLETARTSTPIAWRRATTSSARWARPKPSCTAPPMPRATSPISCSPPRRSSSISCASRWATCVQGRDPRAGREIRAGRGRQARQPGHLLRAERRLRRVIEKLRPGAADPGEIVDMDGNVLGNTGA